MNVLHVVPSVAPSGGGPARSVPALVQALSVRGVHARMAAFGAADTHVRIAHLRGPGEVPTIGSTRALAAAIADSTVVEIHSLWNGTTTVAAALCRRAAVPYVLAPRGMLDPACLSSRRLLKRAYGWLLEDATLAGAAGFHFLSAEERGHAVVGRTLRQDEGVIAPNAAPVLPHPLPRGVLRARFPAVGDGPVALYLGRLDRIKGIDLQLQALAMMPALERPRLLIVGPDYGERASLEALVRRLDLERWVVWGAPVYGDERFSLLADADLVLLTSRYDANPVLVTEAVAAGAVLIGTEGCGGMDAAARADAAREVARTPEAVAAAMASVLTDQNASAALRIRAQHYAATALTPDRTLAPLLDLYARLAQLAGGARKSA